MHLQGSKRELADAPGANGFDCLVDRGAYERAILDRDRYRFALERIVSGSENGFEWQIAKEALGD